MFAAALEIAAPVFLALLITDVAFGVVSRVVPQLNVFAVGFPTKVAVALLVVGASLPFVANWISRQLSVSVGAALGALHVAESMAREDRTEKATPKHRKRAREKGQVARSTDLGGSVVVCRRPARAQHHGPADRAGRRGDASAGSSARSPTPAARRPPPGWTS